MNTPRKPQRRSPNRARDRRRHASLTPLNQLLWAVIGVVLTILGTLLEASITTPPWLWHVHGVQFQPLGVFYQVGAVLLISCVGGPLAAAGSQLAYLVLGIVLGLVGWGIFTHGGGPDYVQQPTFGYLLGFIPGAWLCGRLAFRYRVTLENLLLSCLAGLGIIHLVGIVYQVGLQLLSPIGQGTIALWHGIFKYSIYHLPGQLAMVCAVVVVAFVVRRALFY